jgi:hypothetical protein
MVNNVEFSTKLGLSEKKAAKDEESEEVLK